MRAKGLKTEKKKNGNYRRKQNGNYRRKTEWKLQKKKKMAVRFIIDKRDIQKKARGCPYGENGHPL